ncbi:DUF2514 family protein [Xenophilus sp. Marseille-Q4582]|uniref:DUF2514 family protein n=1 Tax=Xenophilus sp. Marseille-Q4582 TaxID=2866600 RepID=UPI001CE408BB|nr:DUF2514 family protein [Xenophilus sp. Marseille-Q4582]
MHLVSLLDLRLWLAAALAAALLWGGVERMRGNDARTALAEFRLTAEKARAEAEARQREIEQQRTQAVQEVATHAQEQINALERDLADSRGAADRLRVAAASAARRACPRPAAPAPSAGEPDPLAVLIDVLGAVGERAAIYAEAADRARIAGLACEAAFDSLMPR